MKSNIDTFYQIVPLSMGVLVIALGLIGQTGFCKKWILTLAKKFAPYEVEEDKFLRLIKFYSFLLLLSGIIVFLMTFFIF